MKTLEVVKQAMQGITGLRITSTYRSPQRNEAVGGSPTSWHLNEENPAVDVAGPEPSMDELAARLASLPYDAELLYKSPGHYDHVHYAIRSSAGVPSGELPDFGDFEYDGTAPDFEKYQTPDLNSVDQIIRGLDNLTTALDAPAVSGISAQPQTMTLRGVETHEGIKVVGQQGSAPQPERVEVRRPKMSADERLRSRPRVGRMD